MKLTALIEIPEGSKYKYEISSNNVRLDRILNQRIPVNYGYFPNSAIQKDGDKLDVFVFSNEPIPQNVYCNVYIIGGFKCEDNGIQDDKILAVLEGEDIYTNIFAVEQYLNTYKNGFKVLGKLTEKEIISLVEEGRY